MATKEEVFQNMRSSIINYNPEAAKSAAGEVLDFGLDPVEAIEAGFAEPIRQLGEAFDRMEIFLPELVIAADAMKAGLEVLEENIAAGGGQLEKKGVVVIGTVEGDIHEIGKTIVMVLLQANGYKVIDLGVSVPVPRFIQAAEENKADVIAMSALLSTTMLFQRDVCELLRNKGIKEKYFVIIGGAPCTSDWSDEIGADGFAPDGLSAVHLLDQNRDKWTRQAKEAVR